MTRYVFDDNNPLEHYLVKQDLLDRILYSHYPISWIWGDSGQGKTVVASMLYEMTQGQKIWLDINQIDSDEVRFLRHLVQAFEQLTPEKKKDYQSISFINQTDLNHLMQDLCEKLFAQLDQHLLLFLDGAHAIDGFLPTFIQAIVEQNNYFLKLCITSRHSPGDEFLPFIADHKIYEIPPTLLQFTINDTVDFLKLHQQTMNDEMLRAHKNNQGKPASIAAGLSGINSAFSWTSQDPVESLLSESDDEQKLLLIELTLYTQITASLLQQISCQFDVYALLTRMSNDQELINITLNDKEQLFTLSPDLLDTLKPMIHQLSSTQFKRAAAWEASTGQIKTALSLYQQAGDFHTFGKLLLEHIAIWHEAGQHRDIADFLNQIPDDEKKKLPWLWVWESMVKLQIDFNEAKRAAELAFSCFKKSGDKQGMYVAIAHVILTYLVKLSNFMDIKTWLQELAEFDSDEAFELIENQNVKAIICYPIWFGFFMVLPNHKLLPHWEQRALSLLLDKSDDQFKLKLLLLLQKGYLYLGENYRIHPLETVVAIGNDKPLLPYDKLNYNLVKIHESWCQGAFAEVRKFYSNSQEIAAAHHLQALMPHTSLQIVVSLLLEGDYVTAKQEIYTLLDQVPHHQTALLHHLYSMEAWRQVLEKDFKQAIGTSHLCKKISAQSGSFAYQGTASIAEIYALSLAGDYPLAREKLIELELYRDINFYAILRFHAHLLNCYLSFMEGDKTTATQHALNAFEFASERCLFHFIWAVPEILSVATSLALEADQHSDYCITLIQQRKLRSPEHALSETSWYWPLIIKTLGGFVSNIEQLSKPGKSRRLQLLILYLTITYTDRGAPMDVLCDALWPDEDISSARHKLDNALYRLRQLLGKDSLNIVNANVQLNREVVWVDVFHLTHLIQQASRLLQTENNSDTLPQILIDICHLHQGEFLQEYSESTYQISNFRIFIESKMTDLMEKALTQLDPNKDRIVYDLVAERFADFNNYDQEEEAQ